MKKLGDNKIHILRPATEQRMRIGPSSSQMFTQSDNSFFILGSVRNLADQKTQKTKVMHNARLREISEQKIKMNMSQTNVPKYVRNHSLPAKIEDELEKAKMKAQQAEE